MLASSLNENMAVDVIAPDARKKVDELFLYWLSEPSTQDLLRQELARVCGLQHQRLDSYGAAGTHYSSHHHRVRPTSPTVRDVTPPPVPSSSTSPSRYSPKSSSKLLLDETPDKKQLHHQEDVDGGLQNGLHSVLDTKTEAEATHVGVPDRLSAPSKPVCIPPFYFPKGKADMQKDSKSLQKAERVFQKHLHQEVSKKEFQQVVKVSKTILNEC